MSRPLGLSRPLALLIAVLSLTMLSVASASASDRSLRATVISLDAKVDRQLEAIELPDDEKSPTFVADYTAAMDRVDGLYAGYGKQIAKQHGSTRAGRTARKLMLRAIGGLREGFRLTTKITLDAAAGTAPAKSDLDRAEKIGRAVERDGRRAYGLLKIEYDDDPGKRGRAATG